MVFISTVDRLEFQFLDDCVGRYLMLWIVVLMSLRRIVCHTQVHVDKGVREIIGGRNQTRNLNEPINGLYWICTTDWKQEQECCLIMKTVSLHERY